MTGVLLRASIDFRRIATWVISSTGIPSFCDAALISSSGVSAVFGSVRRCISFFNSLVFLIQISSDIHERYRLKLVSSNNPCYFLSMQILKECPPSKGAMGDDRICFSTKILIFNCLKCHPGFLHSLFLIPNITYANRTTANHSLCKIAWISSDYRRNPGTTARYLEHQHRSCTHIYTTHKRRANN